MRILLLIAITLSMATAETTMIKDPTTNLIWEDTPHSDENKVTHSEAKKYCSNLKLSDVSGWRLPTVNELISIVDYTRYAPAILKEFSHTSINSLYWTSTPYHRAKNKFWGVDFKDGATDNASKNYNRYVRCVRVSE